MDPADNLLLTKNLRDALKQLYSRRSQEWTISQLFDDAKLNLKDCHVRLSIIDRRVQCENEPTRLHSSKTINKSDLSNLIKLEDVFTKNLQGMKEYKKVLILGQAGIGKSTLCSKIAYEFYENSIWNDKFDLLLWVSLRDLRQMRQNDKQIIEDIKGNFVKEHFSKLLEPIELESLKKCIFMENSIRVIFILDGLDEVAGQFQQDKILREFLDDLINQPNVILTSRPYGVSVNDLQGYLQLETVGFSSKDVKIYLSLKLHDDKVSLNEINSFIETNAVLSGLVNIPIQLSIICYCWKGLNKSAPITITILYKETISKLWLAFIRDGRCEPQKMKELDDEVKKHLLDKGSVIGNVDIDDLVNFESAFIEYVAFKMFQDDIFQIDAPVLQERKDDFLKTQYSNEPLKYTTAAANVINKTFFLHTPDFEQRRDMRRYHFIHLTFQEFFTAKYLARNIDKIEIQHFIRDNKFNPKWEVVWRFLAGMLQNGKIETFFDLLEQDPIDILGSFQQRLLLMCVNECNFQLAKKRKCRLLNQFLNWMSYVCNFLKKTSLLSDILLPDELVEKLLSLMESAPEQSNMVASVLSHQQLSATVVMRLVKLFSDESQEARMFSNFFFILNSQKQLPDEAIRHLMIQPDNYDSIILGSVKRLPSDIVQQLIDFLQNSNTEKFASEVLSRQRMLPTGTCTILIQLLQNINFCSIQNVEKIMCNQKRLDGEAVTLLLCLVQSEVESIRRSAVKIMKGYGEANWMLDDEQTKTVNQLLQSKAYIIDIVNALTTQKNLPLETVKTLITLMGSQHLNKELETQVEEILCNQIRLEGEAVTLLLCLLQSEVESIRRSAVKIMKGYGEEYWMLDDEQTKTVNQLLQSNAYIIDIVNALTTQNNLPLETVKTLITLMGSQHLNKELETQVEEILRNQERLEGEAVSLYLNLLKSGEGYKRKSAMKIADWSAWMLNKEQAENVNKLLQSDEYIVDIVRALVGSNNLPLSTVKTLITLLEDNSQRSVDAATKQFVSEILRGQDNLKLEAVKQLNTLLNGGTIGQKKSALLILERKYLSLDAKTTATFAELLKSDEEETTLRALTALKKHDKLPNTLVDILIKRLSSESLPRSYGRYGLYRLILSVLVIQTHLSDKFAKTVLEHCLKTIEHYFTLYFSHNARNTIHNERNERDMRGLLTWIIELLFCSLDLLHNAKLCDAPYFHQNSMDNICKDFINYFSELKKLMDGRSTSYDIYHILWRKQSLSRLHRRISLLRYPLTAQLYFDMLSKTFWDGTPVALYIKNSENIDQHQLCLYNQQGLEEKVIIDKKKKHLLMNAYYDSKKDLKFSETPDEITRFIRYNRPDRKKRLESIIYLGSMDNPNTMIKSHGLQLDIKKNIDEHCLQIRFFKDHKGEKISEKMLNDALEKELSNSNFVWYHLDLSNSFLNDEHFIQTSRLLSEKGKNIRTLNFSHNLITQLKFMDGLRNLTSCTSLIYLFMDHNNIYMDVSFCESFFDGHRDQNGEFYRDPILQLFSNLEGLDLSMNFIREGKLLSIADADADGRVYDNILAPQEILNSRIPQKDRTFCQNKIEKSEIVYSVYNGEWINSILDKKKSELLEIDSSWGIVALLEYKSKFPFLHISRHSFLVIEQINSNFGQRELIRVDLFRQGVDEIKIVIVQYSPAQLIDSTNELKDVHTIAARRHVENINSLKNEIFNNRNSYQFIRYEIFPRGDGTHNCGSWNSEMLRAAGINREFIPIRHRSSSCFHRQDV